MKTALVTGAADRMGKAIAIDLAQKGFDIVLHYNSSSKKALETQKEILKTGVKCSLLEMDFSVQDGLEEKIRSFFSHHPSLSLVVNSASVFEKLDFFQSDTGVLAQHFNVNLFAPILLCREFAKSFSSGHVINILDARIKSNTHDRFAYFLSKKALADCTRMLANTLAPNFRVNGIAPGWILDYVGGALDEEKVKRAIPLNRQGTVEEINLAVSYLLDNKYCTGEILNVDGGRHLEG